MTRVDARARLLLAMIGLAALAWTRVATAQSTGAASPGAEVCVGDPAKQALAACPNEGPLTFTGKPPQVSFHSALAQTSKREPQPKHQAPSDPTLEARDDRKSRLFSREKGLLVTEIQQLENLLATTPGNAPDRPTVVRRLAEDYVELEAAAFKEKTKAEIERDGFRKANAAAVAGQRQAVVNADGALMSAARAKAEILYGTLVHDYPSYPQLDEVLYYLAYEYEQGNQNDKARQTYLQLIRMRPDSRYIPNAYLAFGELFFDEAQGDPTQWENAKQAYVKVIGYPPPNDKVYGYAWYKLAYVFWNNGEYDKALNAFKKTIDYGVAYSQVPNAAKLADSARRDIIPVYALKGDPSAAYNFFHDVSGDAGRTQDRTFKMMDELGASYLDTGHYPEAILLYKDLLARDRSGEKTCAYQAHVTEAVMAMRSGNKDVIVEELETQLKSYKDFERAHHPAEAKDECANKTAALLTETAMAWHVEAVGSPGQRGTGDPKTMKLAAHLYATVTETWDARSFSRFQFPRIVKDDWPSIYKVKYAMADLLYFEEKWIECGRAFDDVVAEDPSGPDAAEAAYTAVLCYQKFYDQVHRGGTDRVGRAGGAGAHRTVAREEEDAKLRPKELTDDQKGMIRAFNRYLCIVHPAKTDAVGLEQRVEVEYARARTYFEAQHWEEASIAFRDIALHQADRDVGIYAAQLYLESVNVLGAHSSPPRTACFDDIAADVPKLIELYCTGERLPKNIEPCAALTKVACDTQRFGAQKLVEQADRGDPKALQLYEQAAGIYMGIWRKYGEAPLRQNLAVQCDRMDEIVYNAAKAYQAARLMAKAIAARMVLVDPINRMDKTELARKATYEIGANYQALTVYDAASSWYENYAEKKPTPEKADRALRDAVQLRLGLGQESEALADAMSFRTKFGATQAVETAAIQFAIGAHYAAKEDWDRARGALEGAMILIVRAPPDLQIEAHATLAEAYAHLHGHENQAKAEYAIVRRLWSNPDSAIAMIRAAYPGEDEVAKQKRVAKALTAVGEAYFFAAEEARLGIVDKIGFPAYHGAGNKADVMRHIQTKVADWYAKKRAAIEKVEPEYAKILDLRVANQLEAPPKWVIAAGSRAGLMWGRFVDEFRSAPIPAEWRNDPELRNAYYEALFRASEPFKVRYAKPALKKCLDLSVTYQYFDNYSRDCEVWLGKNYKSEYHLVDELRGAPTLSNSALADRSPPLTVAGQTWHARP
jgi:TolA-binding protein